MLVILILVAVLAVGVGVILWRSGAGCDSAERTLMAVLPPLMTLTAALVAVPILLSPSLSWNDLRLAPAAALWRGYELYYLPGDGPMLGHIYGPVSPLVYVPATLLPTPSAAIRAGVLTSFVLYLLPAVLLLKACASSRRVLVAGCLTAFGLFGLVSDVVSELAFRVHADAPAIGFAALACVPLVDAGRRHDRRWLVVSALLAVLAAGSKQVAFPVLLALPTYVWLVDGRRAFVRYGSLVFGVGLVALALVALLTDVPAMLYQTLVVPSGHPWRYGDPWVVFAQTVRDLVPRAAIFAGVIGSWAASGLWGQRGRLDLRRWASDSPWLAPVLIGLFCIPTAMLGRMKVGGSMAALAYTVYFLVVGAMLVLVQVADRNPRLLRGTAARLVNATVLVVLGVLTVRAAPELRGLPTLVDDLSRDAEASGYAFVQANPDQVYVPYHPLLGLMADGRADHLLLPMLSQQYAEYAAGGPDLAASDADDAAFHRFTPPRLRYVLVREDGGSPMTALRIQPGFEDHLQRYLPEYERSIQVAPGWSTLVSEASEDRR